MNLIDFSFSPLSLLPPLVALSLSIITRRVLLSLGAGILLGALLLTGGSPSDTVGYIGSTLANVFVHDGELNTGNMNIVIFLVLLGMMTALLTLSGGTRAFAEWAQSRVKSKRSSKVLAVFLGYLIFIDDYFNCLALGTIARPVTDRFYVSRAKLAYILDSTGAPVCVITPASSWGAYIMMLVSGILVSHGITEYSPLSAFMHLIPMNFYAIFALLMVLAVAWFQLDIGLMRRHEIQASQGQGFDTQTSSVEEEITESEHGKASYLILPIILLLVATVVSMLYTGNQVLASEGKAFSLLGAFENTDVGRSLIYGSLVALALALYTVFKQQMPLSEIAKVMWIGVKSMFGAILILIFAWSIGAVIGDVKTGAYLSSLVQGNINHHWLPVILFLLSCVMAFATGTSWGTFGIMLPIAGDMASATDINLMLPMLSAVLAGSVFGDHCSPISATSVLSAKGADCPHGDHVATQLPYALIVASISAVGFIVLGMTTSIVWSLLASGIAFVLACCAMSVASKAKLPRRAMA